MKNYSLRGSITRRLCGVALGLAVTAIAANATAQAPIGVVAGVTGAGRGVVFVSGTQTVFLARGMTAVGVLYPTQYDSIMCLNSNEPDENSPTSPIGQNMRAAQTALTAAPLPGLGYNASIQAMISDVSENSAGIYGWGLNTLRLQVSQGALAYEYQNGLSAYTRMVQGVVAQARAANLVVILSMQTESLGCTPYPNGNIQKLPDINTENAWTQLLSSTITNDTGVALEVFNEPATKAECGTLSWTYWATGCGEQGVTQTLGMVTLADYVRSLSTNNMLLLDGDHYANQFETSTGYEGVPYSSIPSNTAYAVHPYNYGVVGTNGPDVALSPSLAQWRADWSFLTTANGDNPTPQAVMVTEWNESFKCPVDPSQTVTNYLVQTFLPTQKIGLIGNDWDAPITGIDYLVNSYNPLPSSNPLYNPNYQVTFVPVDNTTTPSNTTCQYGTAAPLLQQQFLQEAGGN